MNKPTVDIYKERYPDLEIKSSEGRRYTSDGLIAGLYRFTEFAPTNSTGQFILEGGEYQNNEVGNSSMLDPGVFKKNPNGWDVRAACNWIYKNSKSASQHACAKYVRMAIEAGGIKTDGRPQWAWKYIDFLPKIGFKMIAKVNRNEAASFRAEPGDIAVYQKNGDPSVPGHMCMWTGSQWTSDFKQNGMFVYKNTQLAYIFRFQA